MEASDWTAALASALLDAESDVRAALRPTQPFTDWPFPGRPPHTTPHSVKTPAASQGAPTITLAQHEARTLLRVAMPQPIGASPLRGAHARMLAATSIWSAHLLTLSDQPTAEDPRDAITAGLALLAELRAWLDAARWHQACRRSGTRWTRKDGAGTAITALLRHQTATKGEQTVNDALREHPLITLAAAADHDRIGPEAAARRRKARRVPSAVAQHDALDLAAATRAAETPAEAAARMQATAAAIATAAAAPPRPPATVEQLRHAAPSKPPIATTTTRRGKAHAA